VEIHFHFNAQTNSCHFCCPPNVVLCCMMMTKEGKEFVLTQNRDCMHVTEINNNQKEGLRKPSVSNKKNT